MATNSEVSSSENSMTTKMALGGDSGEIKATDSLFKTPSPNYRPIRRSPTHPAQNTKSSGTSQKTIVGFAPSCNSNETNSPFKKPSSNCRLIRKQSNLPESKMKRTNIWSKEERSRQQEHSTQILQMIVDERNYCNKSGAGGRFTKLQVTNYK